MAKQTKTPAEVLSALEKRAASDKINEGYTTNNRLIIDALLFIAERLVVIEKGLTLKVKRPRKASEWNSFFAAGMKAGKTPAQIGAEWRERKAL